MNSNLFSGEFGISCSTWLEGPRYCLIDWLDIYCSVTYWCYCCFCRCCCFHNWLWTFPMVALKWTYDLHFVVVHQPCFKLVVEPHFRWLLSCFLLDICWEKVAGRNIFFIYPFGVWPGVWSKISRLTSQYITYQTPTKANTKFTISKIL